MEVGDFCEEADGFAAAGGGEDEAGIFAGDHGLDLLGVEGLAVVGVRFLLFASDEGSVVGVAAGDEFIDVNGGFDEGEGVAELESAEELEGESEDVAAGEREVVEWGESGGEVGVGDVFCGVEEAGEGCE